MTRIFRYIHKSDTGMAPCIDNGLLSLATCKPKIRVGAKPGDWVMGFYPSPAPSGTLCWAGRIGNILDIGRYEAEYRGRSDAVYRQQQDGGFRRLRPDYHPGTNEIRKDLSGPALVFDPSATWYLGDQPLMLPETLMHLAARGQGHRVNGTSESDVAVLTAWLASASPAGFHGKLRHPQPPRKPLQHC
jgi:hypothetical protein